MTHTTIDVDATSDDVFAVLADPFAYERWVVGAQRIRGVDPEWPAVGSRFYHRVGIGPLHVRDSSKLLEFAPPSRLALEVRVRPGLVGVVDIVVEPITCGVRVHMSERPVAGAATRWWGRWADAAVQTRNRVSLWRLKRLVEREAPRRA